MLFVLIHYIYIIHTYFVYSHKAVYICFTGQADTDSRIRLVGGGRVGSGRVELLGDSGWGTVCDDLFDVKDGAVACVMAGFLP